MVNPISHNIYLNVSSVFSQVRGTAQSARAATKSNICLTLTCHETACSRPNRKAYMKLDVICISRRSALLLIRLIPISLSHTDYTHISYYFEKCPKPLVSKSPAFPPILAGRTTIICHLLTHQLLKF